MLLPAILLFLLFLALSAFFSSAETAFIAANPYTLQSLESRGSKKARLVRRVLARIDGLLATILIGNTLVNAAAASVATTVFVSFIPRKNEAVLLATLTTTLLVLFFGEINPKTFAAHNPVKTAFLFIHPVRFLVTVLSPLVRVLSFLSRVFFPSARGGPEGHYGTMGEEEVRILLGSGVRGLSSPRRRMISGILDFGSRPIKEIMIPRPQVRAIEVESSVDQVRETIRSAGFSRYPVFKGRMDNIEGLLHAKDLVSLLLEGKEFDLRSVLRKPFFVPESAPMEKVLLQMQENAVHMAFVVDEFGSLEGIVTLEDIIEEIVGDIRDEQDETSEAWFQQAEGGDYLIKGSASVNEINRVLPFKLPEKRDYTTLAGFFLYEFGHIPKEKDALDHEGRRFVVERMNKRHISLIRIRPAPAAEETSR
jgi:putative hemolysin